MNKKTVHIISDPIHGAMRFTSIQKEIVKKIIDDRIFQRLRRIKQLGCGDLLFPGAVHTRFNHMIGVCYLAKRMCVYLKLDEKLEDKDIHEIMVAGLLHDVGHGPFSHAFEKVFISNICKDAEISHDEDWLKKFLEYFKSLAIPNLDFSQVEAILLKTLTGDSRFKADIISSQLDVDRMDYLLRDSHFCGVPYGKIDLKWLLSCIKVCKVNGEKRLSISKKGIGALEHYINARRLMTKYIYYHGKKNASEYYVRRFLESICDLTYDKNIINFPIINFLRLYKEYIQSISNNRSKSIKEKALRELVARKKAEKEKRDTMINELIEMEFPVWRKQLTQDEIKQIVPAETLKVNLAPAITAALRTHYVDNVLLPRLDKDNLHSDGEFNINNEGDY